MHEGAVALGSNLGDRGANIAQGLALLCDGGVVRLLAASSLHETAPWGPVPQGDYLNAAALIVTALTPLDLLDRAKSVERAVGRTPGERYGPRVLDIDLLWLGDFIVQEPALTLPHPRMFERAFVLAPLAEIAGDRVVGGRRIADATAALMQKP